MEITYRKEGAYLLPNLEAPESPKIGKYGLLRFRYLRENKRATFIGMQISGKLNSHLEQIDREATKMVEHLTKQMSEAQGVNEELKRTDQMRWVGMMNSLRASAEEIILNEFVFQ